MVSIGLVLGLAVALETCFPPATEVSYGVFRCPVILRDAREEVRAIEGCLAFCAKVISSAGDPLTALPMR